MSRGHSPLCRCLGAWSRAGRLRRNRGLCTAGVPDPGARGPPCRLQCRAIPKESSRHDSSQGLSLVPTKSETFWENEAHRTAVREGLSLAGAEAPASAHLGGKKMRFRCCCGGSVSGTRPCGWIAWLNLSGACGVSVRRFCRFLGWCWSPRCDCGLVHSLLAPSGLFLM